MKNYADLGGCYPPKSSASADNTLLDLHNSSYHTQPHPIIVNCYFPGCIVQSNFPLNYIYLDRLFKGQQRQFFRITVKGQKTHVYRRKS